MNRTHRLLALLLQLLLLHAGVLWGGVVCPREAADAADAAARVAHHHAPAPGHAPEHAPAPHEHGMQHCMLAGGCALIAEAGPAFVAVPVVVVHGAVVGAQVRVPRSTRPAPEPPPPRA